MCFMVYLKEIVMKIGYTWVSIKDQNLELQLEALNKTGCTKIFQDSKSAVKNAGTEKNVGTYS